VSRKVGADVPLSDGSRVPIKYNVAWAEAYLHIKWHPNPSNGLVTIHQRLRQSRQTTVLYDGEPFYKGVAQKLYVLYYVTVCQTGLVNNNIQ